MTNPTTYLLEDDLSETPMIDVFYEQELAKFENYEVNTFNQIVLLKKDNKVKLRRLSFDKSHDNWIEARALL